MMHFGSPEVTWSAKCRLFRMATFICSATLSHDGSDVACQVIVAGMGELIGHRSIGMRLIKTEAYMDHSMLDT